MSSRTRARAADEGLPPLGEWDGPIHGELGVLAVEGDRVQCHACGGWYQSVGHHAVLAHRVSADEYRALFGLRASTGLIGPALEGERVVGWPAASDPLDENSAFGDNDVVILIYDGRLGPA